MFARSFDGPSCSVNRDVGTDILTRVSMHPMLDIQTANSSRYSPRDKLLSDSRNMQPVQILELSYFSSSTHAQETHERGRSNTKKSTDSKRVMGHLNKNVPYHSQSF